MTSSEPVDGREASRLLRELLDQTFTDWRGESIVSSMTAAEREARRFLLRLEPSDEQ